MSQIDIAILVIAGLGAVQGFIKGFVLSITSLLGLILGFYLSLRFAWFTEGILKESTGSESPLIHILAFALSYLLVIVIMYIIGKSIEKMLELASLGCLNRIAGALFGVFKGLLLASAIIYVFEIADRNNVIIKREKKEVSIFYKPIAQLIPSLVPQVKKGIEQLKDNDKKTTATPISPS
ncbi:MAG: CvpA family protein [Chloroflexota bacterium]|nr:CvpA family protein [Lentimicrobium sp.]